MTTQDLELDRLRDLLPIDKYNLDAELEKQAVAQEYIGRRVSELNFKLGEAKERLSSLEARLTGDAASYDGRRMTESQSKALIQRHPERKTLWQITHNIKFELDQWLQLQEAWKGRSFSMTNLSNLYQADYFTVTNLPKKDKSGEQMGLRKTMAENRTRRKLESN